MPTMKLPRPAFVPTNRHGRRLEAALRRREQRRVQPAPMTGGWYIHHPVDPSLSHPLHTITSGIVGGDAVALPPREETSGRWVRLPRA